MAAAKRTAAKRGQVEQPRDVARELEDITSRLRSLIAQLQGVVERMVGPEGAAGGVQLRVVEGQRRNGSPEKVGRDDGGQQPQAERGAAPESQGGAPPAQAVAGQIRGMLEQIERVPAEASGEVAAALADQLRGIVEQLGQQPASNGAQQPGSQEGQASG